MLFFLFFVGLQVSLADLREMRHRAILIGLIGTLLPIAAGVGFVYLLPKELWGAAVQKHFLSFALFIGMNLANSANPVIARVLMDLGLLNAPIGTLIMSATVVDDLINWTVFAIILSDIAPAGASPGGGLAGAVVLTAVYFLSVLVLGRWAGAAGLCWARKHVTWPSGFIAVTAVLILLASSGSEALGVHAFLGAFVTGVALSPRSGDEEQKQANDVIGNFVLGFFAPVYFISMGMNTNFIRNFDAMLTLLIFAAACASKIAAVLLGAKAAGMPLDREAWAVAFGLNARGATGIILAGVGLANQVIDERIFVAIVLMAMITSLMSGPVMKYLLTGRAAGPGRPAVQEARQGKLQ
jgi:Kef-type K+ transport system membrane component KefB